MAQTEFNDKDGKPLFEGDIVYWRLGNFAKTGGPSYHRVVKTKRGYALVNINHTDMRPMLMRTHDEKFMTLYDKSGRVAG